MTNRILIVLLALFSGLASHAQSLQYGIKGGLNIAGVNGPVNVELSRRVSANIGAFLSFGAGKVRIQPEILYSGQGVKFTYRAGNPSAPVIGETTTKMGYLNFPLVGKFFLGKSLNFQVGPQFGILLSAHEKGEIQGVSVDDDLNEIFKSTDISLLAGLGYNILDKFTIDIRYTHSVSDLSEDEGQNSPGFEEPKIQNSVVQFSFGILF